MRLVTWNCCRGSFHRKASLIDHLAPDITVLQECARPAIIGPQCLWFGDNPRQGIAITACSDFRLSPLPVARGVPKFCFPIQVTGRTNFVLFAVWAKANPKFPYVEGVVRAIRLYRRYLQQEPSVLVGDTNSNAIWDSGHPEHLCHSAMVRHLDSFGLVSSYHHYFGEPHGAETRPTYYFHWKKEKPYHLDYCFIPKPWAERLTRVDVGSYEDWSTCSDHRPILVELEN